MPEAAPALAARVAEAAGGALAASRAVPGGDINAAMRVELADGRVLFAKHRPDPAPGAFAAEAEGLRWLREAGALPVPEVVAVDEAFLALAWVDAGPPAADAGARLGEGLARLHLAGAARHGATPGDRPTDLGSVRVPNDPPAGGDGWPAFFTERRLLPLLRMAVDRSAVTDACARRVEAVAARAEDLLGPPEPPARLHGDLWSGNVMTGPDGGPVLVDPAAHGGHREVDLALLRLFGTPGPAFDAAYADVHPLAEGAAERVALHQLVPLLVHAVLFGGGYGAQVDRAAARYVA